MAAEDRTVEIEQLLSRAEQEPRTHTFVRLADLYRQAGEHERALGVIRDGLREHPYYLDARLLHARVLLELGRDEVARVEFEHILSLDPANPLACMALGVERVETRGSDGPDPADDWLEALEDAWRSDGADARPAPAGGQAGAPAVSPKGIETSTLAGLYASQGLFDRAIGVYEQMLSRDPDNADLSAALAAVRRRAEEAGGPPSGRPAAASSGAPRDVPPAEDGAESAAPAAAEESIGEQLRRILDGEAPARPD
ncbi:tetratricopeptide repeat protein [Candidatus Palauibacter irciniicola]|uniref:tetratricopeptide repeat protein n=1 Tax=Candidatus Palauibacter irciniicola TaxID=3056733 RepID=UPI003B020F61